RGDTPPVPRRPLSGGSARRGSGRRTTRRAGRHRTVARLQRYSPASFGQPGGATAPPYHASSRRARASPGAFPPPTWPPDRDRRYGSGPPARVVPEGPPNQISGRRPPIPESKRKKSSSRSLLSSEQGLALALHDSRRGTGAATFTARRSSGYEA